MTVGPVIILAGPTASGKSGLGLKLAEQFGGSVVNADSMQVYRELTVLTDRPTSCDEKLAPHHLYGVLSVFEQCSVGWWQRKSIIEVGKIIASGRIPIFVGGTGLYIDALINGIACIPKIPKPFRRDAIQLYEEVGGDEFRLRLSSSDEETAARLHPSDKQRLVRAWEVFQYTGRPISEWHANSKNKPISSGCFVIKLMPPRQRLYRKCNSRFVRMVSGGALDEVVSLAALGLHPSMPAMKALGVSALLSYIQGKISLEDACSKACQETRNYAKRQYTWFRNQLKSDIDIVDPIDSQQEVISAITAFLLTSQRQPTSVPPF